MNSFRIYTDDAYSDQRSREHSSYYNFYGGIGGPAEATEALTEEIEWLVEDHGFEGEIKWRDRFKALNQYQPLMMDISDTFFDALEEGDIHYRAVCYSARQNLKKWLCREFGEVSSEVAISQIRNESLHASAHMAFKVFEPVLFERGEIRDVEIFGDTLTCADKDRLQHFLAHRMQDFRNSTGLYADYQSCDSRDERMIQLTDFMTGFFGFQLGAANNKPKTEAEKYILKRLNDYTDSFIDFRSPERLTGSFNLHAHGVPSIQIDVLDRKLPADACMLIRPKVPEAGT